MILKSLITFELDVCMNPIKLNINKLYTFNYTRHVYQYTRKSGNDS